MCPPLALIHTWKVPTRGEATVVLFPHVCKLHIVDFGCQNWDPNQSGQLKDFWVFIIFTAGTLITWICI